MALGHATNGTCMAPLDKVYIPPSLSHLVEAYGLSHFRVAVLAAATLRSPAFTQPTKNNTVPSAPPGMHVRRPLPHLALSTLTSLHQHAPQAPPSPARCASSVFPQRPLSYLASHRAPRPTSPHVNLHALQPGDGVRRHSSRDILPGCRPSDAFRIIKTRCAAHER